MRDTETRTRVEVLRRNYGTYRAAAEVVGVHPSTLSAWYRDLRTPQEYPRYLLELVTDA
jgi:hypothetical protein